MTKRTKILLATTLSSVISLCFLTFAPQEPIDEMLVASASQPVAKSKSGSNTKNSPVTGSETKGSATKNEATTDTEVQFASEEPATLDYQPPFPDRTNLFQPPTRQRSGRSKTNSRAETEVSLLGFVNVSNTETGKPDAILSINGLATIVPEGGMVSDIEVTSIKPPFRVLLKSGNQRWHESLLEN